LEAVRDIVINAIVHRDYSSSSDSIVKIFDDRIEVFNPGSLSTGLTVEKLLTGDYVSVIRNRKIADIFKEIGLIEKYGTGIKRILQGFEDYGLPVPKFEEIAGGFRVTAFKDSGKAQAVEDIKTENRRTAEHDTTQVTTHDTTQVTTQVDDIILHLLQACEEPATLTELMFQLGYRSRKHFRAAIVGNAINKGFIERTSPDKPQSRFQRYRLTEKGKEILVSQSGKGS
jgi:ATP-dependent DNA helicase RecG